jgi:hypothetical protein
MVGPLVGASEPNVESVGLEVGNTVGLLLKIMVGIILGDDVGPLLGSIDG